MSKKALSFLVLTILIVASVVIACQPGAATPTRTPPVTAEKPASPPVVQATATPPPAKAAVQPLVLKISHTSPAVVDDSKHMWSEKFKETVESRSKGLVKVEIFPFGQLYKEEAEALTAVAKGDVQIAIGGPSTLVGAYEPAGVFILPGVFVTDEQVLKFVASPDGGKKISEALGAKNISIVSWLSKGPNQIFGVKKWTRLSDLKGKKIACAVSKMNLDMLKALGATGISVPPVERYTALQQGVADGVLTVVEATLDYKWTEVLKSSLEGLPVGYIVQQVAVNKKVWDSTPTDIRQILDDSSKLAMDFTNEGLKKVLQSKREAAMKIGLEFFKLPADDIAKAIADLAPVVGENRAIMGFLIDEAAKWR